MKRHKIQRIIRKQKLKLVQTYPVVPLLGDPTYKMIIRRTYFCDLKVVYLPCNFENMKAEYEFYD